MSCAESASARLPTPPRVGSSTSVAKEKASIAKPTSVVEQVTDTPPLSEPFPSPEVSIGLGTIGSTFLESLFGVPASSEAAPGSPLHFDIFSEPSEDLRSLGPFLRLSPPGRSSGDASAERETSGATSESDYASGADTPTFGAAAIIMSFSAYVTRIADSTSFAKFSSLTSPEIGVLEASIPCPVSEVSAVLTESTIVTPEVVPQTVEPVKEIGEESREAAPEEGEFVEEEEDGEEAEEGDDEESVDYESDSGYHSDPSQGPSIGFPQAPLVSVTLAVSSAVPVEIFPRIPVSMVDVTQIASSSRGELLVTKLL